jgi:hypothetical protein
MSKLFYLVLLPPLIALWWYFSSPVNTPDLGEDELATIGTETDPGSLSFAMARIVEQQDPQFRSTRSSSSAVSTVTASALREVEANLLEDPRRSAEVIGDALAEIPREDVPGRIRALQLASVLGPEASFRLKEIGWNELLIGTSVNPTEEEVHKVLLAAEIVLQHETDRMTFEERTTEILRAHASPIIRRRLEVMFLSRIEE